MDPVVITGVRNPDGSVLSSNTPLRLEINDFIKNEMYFSLYIQAIQVMYASDWGVGDPTSYYQISGIHGEPFTPWNGATAQKDGNYCQHQSVLFPTWHRPYLLLFEQTLQQRAVEIAQTYTTNRDSWISAAINLRQPYWDWAQKAGPIPPKEVISMQQVQITVPSGVKALVDNPFLAFTFPSQESRADFDGDFQIWQQTLRNPRGEGDAAVTSVEDLIASLNTKSLHLRSYTYKALWGLTTWNEFSTKGATQGGMPVSSLESIHDTIHVRVGGTGHMADLSVAAFDPIFWLHHCQIDRLLSLWYAVRPGVWVSPDRGQNVKTELLPFWNSPQSIWTSSGLQDTAQFNYTYPEFQGIDMTDPSTPAYIMRLIEYLYNDGPIPSHPIRAVEEMKVPAAAEVKATSVVSIPNVTQAALREVKVQGAPGNEDTSSTSLASVPKEPYTALDTINWTARLRFDQFEVDSSFTIFIFFCKPSEIPDDPRKWSSCPELAGFNDVFVNSRPERCANCQANSDLATEDYVQLDDALLESVQSVEKDVVVPFLKENLHWRVAKTNGTVVNLNSLEIVVIATPMSRSEEVIFPAFGEPQHIHEVISGRH